MQPQLDPLDRFAAVNPGGNPFAPQFVPRRPGYLVFLCVFSILLGCLGALRGGCAMISRPPFGFASMEPRQPTPIEIAAAKGRAIDSKYNRINRTFFGAQAVIGIVMVIGASLVLQSRRPGDWLLRGAFVATLLVGAIHMLPFLSQMLEHHLLSRQLISQASRASAVEGAGINYAATIAMVTAIGGTIGAVAWLIFKVALLGHGFRYLGKPEVQDCLR